MGLVLPQEVKIKVASMNYKYFQSKGYDTPKKIGYDNKEKISIGESIKVNVLDLMDVSHVKVKIKCDYCGCIDEVEWVKVVKSLNHKENQKITCCNCNGKKLQEIKRNEILNTTNIKSSYWDSTWLESEYIEKNRTAQSIADECGVHIRRIEKYIKRYELDTKFIPPKEKMPKDLLYDLYVIKHWQPEEIRKEYKIDRSTINLILKEYGIPQRTHSESMAVHYDERNGRYLKSVKNKEIWMRDGYRERMINIRRTSPNFKIGAIKHSANYQGIDISEWNGFLTNKNTRIRNSLKYKTWVHNVFEKNNYTCQCCGARNGKGQNIYLNAHHKENFADNPELRFDVNNGITLCSKCHDPRIDGSFHNTYGTLHNTTEQLIKYIKKKQSEVA